MRSVLDGMAAAEGPGVLHTQKGWYAPPIDGLDNDKFTSVCFATLTRPQPYIEGTQGASSDDGNGNMTVNVEVGGPLNTLCIDLRRVLPLVHRARAAQPGAPLIEMVRPVLQGMARGEIPGGMWTRGIDLGYALDVVDAAGAHVRWVDAGCAKAYRERFVEPKGATRFWFHVVDPAGSRSAARVLVLLGPETMVFARWRGDEPAARAWTFPA
jgi:hypothetical protein